MPIDRETQLLIATGAAVACGCLSCLDNIVSKARGEGIDEKKLKAAAITGQYVKDMPMNHMKAHCDDLLGTHLGGFTPDNEPDCPMGEAPGAKGETRSKAEADETSGEPKEEPGQPKEEPQTAGMPVAMMKTFMKEFMGKHMGSCGCMGDQPQQEGKAKETQAGCGCS